MKTHICYIFFQDSFLRFSPPSIPLSIFSLNQNTPQKTCSNKEKYCPLHPCAICQTTPSPSRSNQGAGPILKVQHTYTTSKPISPTPQRSYTHSNHALLLNPQKQHPISINPTPHTHSNPTTPTLPTDIPSALSNPSHHNHVHRNRPQQRRRNAPTLPNPPQRPHCSNEPTPPSTPHLPIPIPPPNHHLNTHPPNLHPHPPKPPPTHAAQSRRPKSRKGQRKKGPTKTKPRRKTTTTSRKLGRGRGCPSRYPEQYEHDE